MEFLRWYYHRQRIASSNKEAFERTLKLIYEEECGKEFPYKLRKVNGVD